MAKKITLKKAVAKNAAKKNVSEKNPKEKKKVKNQIVQKKTKPVSIVKDLKFKKKKLVKPVSIKKNEVKKIIAKPTIQVKKPLVKVKEISKKIKPKIAPTKKLIIKNTKAVVKSSKKIEKPKIKAKKIQSKKLVIKKPEKNKVISKPSSKTVVKFPKPASSTKKVVKKPLKIKQVTPKKKVQKPVKLIVEKDNKKVIKKQKEKVKIKPIVKKTSKPIENILPKRIIPIRSFQNFETNYNRADMFYKNVLKGEIIKRYSAKNDADIEFLKKDISLKIKLNDKETNISEKMRDQDWNDIYVEIYHKYPEEDGWIKNTETEYLGYFFPGRVFWAKMEPIKVLCQDILSKANESGIYKELLYMFPKNSGRLSKTFKINTKTYSFNFIQTYHEDNENSYYSIGISLPFVLLMDFRIFYNLYRQ